MTEMPLDAGADRPGGAPSRGRSARRNWWAWAAAFFGVGLIAGPLVSGTVSHGHFNTGSLVFGALLVTVVAPFTFWWVRGDSQATYTRTLTVLLLGSVLFMLPRAATITAADSPLNSWTVDMRWLACCVPYALVAWIACPVRGWAVRLVPMAGLVALVSAWPEMVHNSVEVAAHQERALVGAPSALLVAVDAPPTAEPLGYGYSDDELFAVYDSGGPQLLPSPDYEPDDLDMVVYPATGSSPCASIGGALNDTVGSNGTGPVSCSALPDGRWLVTGQPESTATTQVERYGAYYVALTVDSRSSQPISPARLPALLASVHRADDAEPAVVRMDTSTLSAIF